MIVFTYGVFDLFHAGHLKLLREARALGGYLIVGVFTDEVAASYKRGRPVVPFKERLDIVRSIDCVNEVFAMHDLQPDKALRQLKVDILAKGPGAGWSETEEEETVPGKATADEMGIRIARLPYHPGQSTSALIEKIKAL